VCVYDRCRYRRDSAVVVLVIGRVVIFINVHLERANDQVCGSGREAEKKEASFSSVRPGVVHWRRTEGGKARQGKAHAEERSRGAGARSGRRR